MAHPLIRPLSIALWICLAVYAVLVTRDFYRFVDRAVYISLDDSLANEAYTLASEGRYGFLASPVLFGIPRHHGEFSYGPWYFYLAASLIWMFGYSLTLVRSIHLWTILGTVAAASFWFRGRGGAVAAGVFGFSILYCFDTTQWPMARPDVLASAFAVLLVICAGIALTSGRLRYWFAAGLVASCGAFNHLIAWSLVASCLLLFGVAAAERFRDAGNRRDTWSTVGLRAAAVAAGVLLGATMFYAAFDFRFSDQARMFAAYRAQIASSESYATLILRHFDLAFGYLPKWQQGLVGATLVGGWALIGAAAWRIPRARPTVSKYLLPPLVVWSGYLVTLGWYANFHKGYAILDEVMAYWTAAAIVWSLLQIVDVARPRLATAASAVLAVVVLALGVRQVQWHIHASAEKIRVEQWVSIADFIDRLLGQLPARATAWGSVMYGIETPNRIQLIQFSEGQLLLPLVPRRERQALSPEFIVWGYPEVRDNAISVLRGGSALLNGVVELIPGVTYRLVSMVVAAPYGVTRLYARSPVDHPPDDTLPQVSVYDAARRQWLSGVDRRMAVDFKPIAPVEMRIGPEREPEAARATRTVAADLPACKYLLRVSVTPGEGGTKRRLLAAVSPKLLRQTITDRGPEGDYSSYYSTDTIVMLVSVHDGGPLYVSQFDNGAGADIRSVEAFPILGLAAMGDTRSLPPVDEWEAAAGVRVSAASTGVVQVDGDASQSGYQLVSPTVSVAPHDRVRVRLDLMLQQGRTCSGILNGTRQRWIVPADELRTDFTFQMNETSSFYVVIANCYAHEAESRASRFAIRSGSYLVERTSLYTDLFMAPVIDALSAKPTDILPGVLIAPSDLRVTRSILLAPLDRLQPVDVAFQADIVRREGRGWSITGRAETAYAYLLRMKDRHLDKDSRVIVTGVLEHGAVAIGLLRDDQWVAQVTVAKPGEFTVVIAPPASGAYSILVTNNVPGNEADTSVVLTKFGVIANGTR